MPKPNKLARYLLERQLLAAIEELTAAMKAHANALNIAIAQLARKA